MWECWIQQLNYFALMSLLAGTGCSLILFEVREINRFFESVIEILEKFFQRLDTRFPITSKIKCRVLSRDCQLTFARCCISNTRKSITPDLQTLRSALKNEVQRSFFNQLRGVWISDETHFRVLTLIWLLK